MLIYSENNVRRLSFLLAIFFLFTTNIVAKSADKQQAKPVSTSSQVISISGTKTYVNTQESSQKQVKSTQKQVTDLLKQLLGLSKIKYTNDSEDKINKIVNQQNKILSDLLLVLRYSDTNRLTLSIDGRRQNFLQSRIEINQQQGNALAVERDQIELEYVRVMGEIKDYLQYLIKASRTYIAIDEVINHSISKINQAKNNASKIAPPKLDTESKIQLDLEAKYHQLQYANRVFLSILNYATINPTKIVKVLWFQQFSLVSAITSLNNLSFIRPINYKLAPFGIDGGGILVSLIIIILIIFCYPIIIKFFGWLIDRIILRKLSDHTALIVQELHKPLKILVLFFGIDMATYALLYKTEYRPSLDHIEFVVYAGIIAWVLCKLLDILFIAQFETLAKFNKDLRKEMINLGFQFAKGVIFIVVLSLVLNRFGISITAIISTLGIGGLAFALAAKDTLSNFFGGITIMIDNVFKMGDWVTIGGDEGTVAEVGLRSTTIRTFDNALITIPNSVVSVSSVKNWNRRTVGRRIKMHIGVTYESNMDDIRQALEDIKAMLGGHSDISNPKEKYSNRHIRFKLSSHEDTHGIKSTQLVFLDRYGDFSIDIMIYCFSKTVDWAQWLRVKEDILFKIAVILKKNNLEFAYPTEVRINRT